MNTNESGEMFVVLAISKLAYGKMASMGKGARARTSFHYGVRERRGCEGN
jgi:hypothetical protein